MWLQPNSRLTRWTIVVWTILASGALQTPSLQTPPPSSRGVIVEEVAKDLAGEKSGIMAGDLLLSWSRAATVANAQEGRGEIGSPFDVADIEIEQAPRGELTLFGIRDGASFSVVVPPGSWGIRVRPRLVEPVLSAYRRGKELVERSDIEKGVAIWRELAANAAGDDWTLAAWLLVTAGDSLVGARRSEAADTEYEAAIRVIDGRDQSTSMARIWDSAGRSYERQNALVNAEAAYRKAVVIRETSPREPLALAWSLTKVAHVAYAARRDLATSEAFNRRSLAIRERLAPNSVDVAANLNNLAILARNRGDLAAAEALYGRSLALYERLAPVSAEAAAVVSNYGAALGSRGDLVAAEAAFRRALVIREQLGGTSRVEAAVNLSNLGSVATLRGDLAAADEFFRRSLLIMEKLAPNSLDVALILHNLGNIERDRGDLAAAETFFKRALAVREKLAAESLDVASTLYQIGVMAADRDDATAAEQAYTRALAIQQKRAPDGLDVATTLSSLARLEKGRGNRAAAHDLLARSLAVKEKLAPGSLTLAETLESVAELARDGGDLVAAEGNYERALAIRERLARGSTSEARSLRSLGLLARRTGRATVAAEYFERAIIALEGQSGRLGGADEVRSGFAAQYVDYYREYVDLLLELDQPVRAFEVLERSRARSLLAMLAERDLVFANDLPADLARERTLINADYDRTQAAITRLNPVTDGTEIGRLLARLRELRDQRERIAQTIRKASPRFAALHYLQPLDLAGAQRSLDRGTVLLAYSVTKEKAFLFVLQPVSSRPASTPPISVFTVPIGEAALRDKVAAFRRTIQRGADGGSPDPVVAAGQELFETLVKPAEALIAASDRVLISPDGPLHTLPFAALVQRSPASSPGASRYFIEWKPIHVVVSATVYAELNKARRDRREPPSSPLIAAFGDPAYPPLAREQLHQIANAEVRAMVRRGYALERLPASRSEVEAIARLYGGRATAYLGDQATEERAKAIGQNVRILHFASHGLLDERFPLNSALALTIPERPAEDQANGLLQAWEIFEQMRIDADLVTLSACETGLGAELGGEGLVGLTRAFQYAGARSVLASLWSVADETTATLMTRFYGYLKDGRSKDAALRQAQLDLIRDARVGADLSGARTVDASHPFHWAAFQLNGDWR